MDQPDIKLFVVAHNNRTFVYSEQAIGVMEASIAEPATPVQPPTDGDEPAQGDEASQAERQRLKAQFELLMERGEWKEIWLYPALGRHEEEINALCQVKDALAGMRFDPAKQPAARLAVIVSKWNGFPMKPSVEAYGNLPLPLAKAIDERILEHMYPSALGPDFFSVLSSP